MSEIEAILRQEAGVKAHESDSPPAVGLKAGAFADVGTLIRTNKRLVYIDKGGAARAAAWAVGGVFASQAIENRVSKAEIDELSKLEGSYAMPLQSITRVEAGKKMGQSYISVDCSGLAKPTHAYVVADGTDNRDWVTAINQARTALQYAPSLQPAAYSVPQPTQSAYVQKPQVASQKICQRCGAPDTLGSKFCTSCGAHLIQTQNEMPLPLASTTNTDTHVPIP